MGQRKGENKEFSWTLAWTLLVSKPLEPQPVAVRGTLKTSKSLTSTSLPSSFAFLQERSRSNSAAEVKNTYFALTLSNVKQ